jgi:CheY-like chemotaxis protein
LLRRRLARGETDVGKYIDGAIDGANRASALTQRLLAFARQQPLSPVPIDANRMVGGMVDLIARSLGENIRMATHLAADLWPVRADANQLENVMLNLAVNARDAMPNGGRLTIETLNTKLDQPQAQEFSIVPGEYVLLRVIDTGVGMSREVMAKAFEPFFTTKDVGKGTGLGLSQVFGFVRQSGGHVKIQSEVGTGTTINVYLPRYYGTLDAPAPADTPRTLVNGRPQEVVLVVEDEARVRSFSVEALRELGYTVLAAESPKEALRIIDSGQHVDVLFTDIVMPEMTGPQLAEAATARVPTLKVLFTTGYSRNAVADNGIIDPATNFLPKPFGIEQLATKIRSAFDSQVTKH